MGVFGGRRVGDHVMRSPNQNLPTKTLKLPKLQNLTRNSLTGYDRTC